jgi:hypothetical protein
MWSLILYFLFGIGQPSNSQSNLETAAVQSSEADQPGDNGGDMGTVRPPRK